MIAWLYSLAFLHGIQYDMVELGIGFFAGALVQKTIFRRRVVQAYKIDRMFLETGSEIAKQQERHEGIFTPPRK